MERERNLGQRSKKECPEDPEAASPHVPDDIFNWIAGDEGTSDMVPRGLMLIVAELRQMAINQERLMLRLIQTLQDRK